MIAGIPPVVTLFADRLHELLGERLVGVYLGGSLVMGDFIEGSSDYDLLVVVSGDLSSADLSRLAALHDHLVDELPDAIRLEGDYVPREALRPVGTSRPVPFFRQGRLQPEPESMLSADNIANMRQDGISVVGPAPASVLPEVSAEQIREAVRQMLREISECPTEQKAASEIRDLVRSCRALETGAPATKSDGLRWGLVRLNAVLHPVLQRADAVRRGTSVTSDDRTLRDGLDEVRAALRHRSSEASSER